MVYISGQMTGVKDLNKPLFKKVENMLIEDIHILNDNDVINPHELNHFKSHTYRDYMVNDIVNLVDCNKIVMLHGWQQSKGAKCELVIAATLGMEIYEYNENNNSFIEMEVDNIQITMKGIENE